MVDLPNADPSISGSQSPGEPFFTVIVPTMNRPEFLEATLKTVLWQTFKNFEVIVSDNSNLEEMRRKNLEIIEKQPDGSKVRYLRPGQWLNMPDHFEFASREARGTYVLILTDRRVMLPHSLEYLHSQIMSRAPGIGLVCWCDHWSYSELSGMVKIGRFRGLTKVLKSKDLMEEFARFTPWIEGGYWSQQIPHTCNGCYHGGLAKEIRKIYGKLFVPVSPDFMAGFLMMTHTPEVLFIDKPLYLQHAAKLLGNGSASFLDGVEGYTNSFPEVDPYEGAPVRLNTLFNTLVRDFLKAKEMTGDKFSGIHPNWVGYYVTNYLEILDKQKMGSGMNLTDLFTLWNEGLAKLAPADQTEVWEIIGSFRNKKSSWIAFRRWVRGSGLAPFYSMAIGKIRNLRQRFSGKPVYSSVFEAAEKTDEVLTKDSTVR